MNDYDRQRVEQLVADISVRLRAVCAHLPDEEFNQLVLDIATVKLKFEALDNAAFASELPGFVLPSPAPGPLRPRPQLPPTESP